MTRAACWYLLARASLLLIIVARLLRRCKEIWHDSEYTHDKMALTCVVDDRHCAPDLADSLNNQESPLFGAGQITTLTCRRFSSHSPPTIAGFTGDANNEDWLDKRRRRLFFSAMSIVPVRGRYMGDLGTAARAQSVVC